MLANNSGRVSSSCPVCYLPARKKYLKAIQRTQIQRSSANLAGFEIFPVGRILTLDQRLRYSFPGHGPTWKYWYSMNVLQLRRTVSLKLCREIKLNPRFTCHILFLFWNIWLPLIVFPCKIWRGKPKAHEHVQPPCKNLFPLFFATIIRLYQLRPQQVNQSIGIWSKKNSLLLLT